MSGKPIRTVHDMEIDEVSLVDRPANQHSAVLITKAYQGDDMPQEIEVFDADGNQVSDEDLQPGDIVQDAQGNQYEFAIDEDGGDDDDDAEQADDTALYAGTYADEPELVSVGKNYGGVSPAFSRRPVSKGVSDSAAALREALSKAVSDGERDDIIAKALAQVDAQGAVIASLTEVAKGERDLRLDREYIEVAKAYNIPSDPDELGPVLKRMAEALDDADCAVIHKALLSAGDALFQEVGYQSPDPEAAFDPYAQAVGYAEQQLAKSADPLAGLSAIEKFFDENPAAYDDYVAARR